MAGCPSGQREQTVNLPAQPTLVRTQHLPPNAQSECGLGVRVGSSPCQSSAGVAGAEAASCADARARRHTQWCLAETAWTDSRNAVAAVYPHTSLAPIAQSVERLHGKEKVYGSIPYWGSGVGASSGRVRWGSRARRRGSSGGQSTRLIIVVSRVRVPPPLHSTAPPGKQRQPTLDAVLIWTHYRLDKKAP